MSADEPTLGPFSPDARVGDARRWLPTGRARTLMVLGLAAVTVVALVAGSPAPTEVDTTAAANDIRVVAASGAPDETTTTASTPAESVDAVAGSAPSSTPPAPPAAAPTTTALPSKGTGTAAGAAHVPSTTTTEAPAEPRAFLGRVFVTWEGIGTGSHILSMRPDGSDLRFEVNDVIGAFDVSADGSAIYYLRWDDMPVFDRRNLEVRRRNLDGSDVRVLAPVHAWDAVRVSPDGRRLALVGDGELYVMDADGDDLRRVPLTSPPHLLGSGSLSWAPDSKRVAVVVSGTPTIVDVDSGSERALPVGGAYPQWSPDGSRILLATCRDGRGGLYSFVVATEQVVPLWTVPRTGTCTLPSTHSGWSHDGSTVFFTKQLSHDEAGLFAVDASGANVRLLTTGPTLFWPTA